MLRFLYGTKIDFIKYWRQAVSITVALILVGLATFLVTGGMRYAIDFTGGTLMQLEFNEPQDDARLRTALAGGGIPGIEITRYGSEREFIIRAQEPEQVRAQGESGAESVAAEITAILNEAVGAENYTVMRTEAVGPKVGSELARNAAIAILLSFGVTLLYLAWRFEWRFGIAAVLATMHDIIATLAFIKLMNLEISLTIVAGILTVIGYSLNDTIIIFDRVRENMKKRRDLKLYDVLNLSINETIPRSVLTHATTLAATLALLILAGEVIRPFAWVMTFGILIGTFSSHFVAPVTLLWAERRWPRTAAGTRRPAPAPARDTGRDPAREARAPRPADARPRTRRV